jgi:tetratricopeptide (TPR) repeat protein
MGQFEQALPQLEQALAIKEAKLGPEHLHVALGLDNLATLHSDMGQYKQAQTLHQRALAIREKTLGPFHSDVAVSLNNLATAYQAVNLHEQALPLRERALAIMEANLEPDHPSIATCINNLASLHQVMGHHKQALPLYERSLAMWETKLGPEHPNVAKNLVNLATVHHGMGLHKQALQLHKRAAGIIDSTLGPNHPAIVSSLVNFAALHKDMCKHQQALQLYKRALAISEGKHGPCHPDVASTMTHLAFLYQAMGKRKLALSSCEQALGIFELSSPAHEHIPICKSLISNLKLQSGSASSWQGQGLPQCYSDSPMRLANSHGAEDVRNFVRALQSDLQENSSALFRGKCDFHGGIECNNKICDTAHLPCENENVECNGYSWAEDRESISIFMPIGLVRGKDVIYKLSPTSLTIGIKGSAPVIDGAIFSTVKPDDSLWEIDVVEGQRKVIATLQKAKAELWGSLLS